MINTRHAVVTATLIALTAVMTPLAASAGNATTGLNSSQPLQSSFVQFLPGDNWPSINQSLPGPVAYDRISALATNAAYVSDGSDPFYLRDQRLLRDEFGYSNGNG